MSNLVLCLNCNQHTSLNPRQSVFDVICLHCNNRFCSRCNRRFHFPAYCVDYGLYARNDFGDMQPRLAQLQIHWIALDAFINRVDDLDYMYLSSFASGVFREYFLFPCNQIKEVVLFLRWLIIHAYFNVGVEIYLEVFIRRVYSRIRSLVLSFPLPLEFEDDDGSVLLQIKLLLLQLLARVLDLTEEIPHARFMDRILNARPVGDRELEDERVSLQMSKTSWTARLFVATTMATTK